MRTCEGISAPSGVSFIVGMSVFDQYIFGTKEQLTSVYSTPEMSEKQGSKK
jgi:hypothetical protein